MPTQDAALAHAPTPMSLAAAVNTLRARGMRVSTPRRLVLEALYGADRPLPAAALADGLGGRFPRADLGSVYRNLDTLEQAGLVRRVELGRAPARYAPATDREYAACERCGELTPLDPALLDAARAAIRAACGHVARFSRVPVSGLCAGCAAGSAPAR